MRTSSLLLLLVVALAAPVALAQSDATTDPREFSEAARKVYAQSLKDARGLIAEKKYADAIAMLDKLSAERPREPQARFLKGLALADAGKTNEAIAVFQAVLGDYPELPEPHNNLAVLYAQKGEYGTRPRRARSRDQRRARLHDRLREPGRHLCAPRRRQLREGDRARCAEQDPRRLKLKLVRDVLAPPRGRRRPTARRPPRRQRRRLPPHRRPMFRRRPPHRPPHRAARAAPR